MTEPSRDGSRLNADYESDPRHAETVEGFSVAPSDNRPGSFGRVAGWVAVVAGGLAVVFAVVSGFVGIRDGLAECGSVFFPASHGDATFTDTFVKSVCERDLGSRSGFLVTMLIFGIVLLIVGAVVVWVVGRRPQEPEVVRMRSGEPSVPTPQASPEYEHTDRNTKPLPIISNVAPQPQHEPLAPAAPSQTVLDELSNLAAMHESGALTEIEYTVAKSRVLGIDTYDGDNDDY